METSPFRGIPQVERILEEPALAPWLSRLSRPLASRIVSGVLEEVRAGIRRTGAAPGEGEILDRVAAECRKAASLRIRRLVNGTGIVLHTNMGRSPLPAAVWDAAREANTGYCNLELDLAAGRRGGRSGLCPRLLAELTGCEDALVVNNNAAAVLLVLSVLARGREVIVSRGEQVQIGGGFRIPEILALSGARLVEVGTTNVTTRDDYLRAVTADTALVLLVHTSNFRVRGFTEKPDQAALAEALPPGVPLVVDQGSGTTTEDIPGETKVRTHLRRGAALVCFSADKVLGGPQAGIVAGRRDLVRTLSAHPLVRAFRPGKTVYALLEEHLVRRLNGEGEGQAERILRIPLEDLRRMGRRILKRLPPGAARLVPSTVSTGGGSAPDEELPSVSLEIAKDGAAEEILKALRDREVPVIGTVEAGRVRLSLATMWGEDERLVAEAVRAALGE